MPHKYVQNYPIGIALLRRRSLHAGGSDDAADPFVSRA